MELLRLRSYAGTGHLRAAFAKAHGSVSETMFRAWLRDCGITLTRTCSFDIQDTRGNTVLRLPDDASGKGVPPTDPGQFGGGNFLDLVKQRGDASRTPSPINDFVPDNEPVPPSDLLPIMHGIAPDGSPTEMPVLPGLR